MGRYTPSQFAAAFPNDVQNPEFFSIGHCVQALWTGTTTARLQPYVTEEPIRSYGNTNGRCNLLTMRASRVGQEARATDSTLQVAGKGD